jgi:8-oxo-dGTP diphosphatase
MAKSRGTKASTEQEFLAEYDPRSFPALAVTVDIVLLTIQHDELHVLLVRRGQHPFQGHWALPGGFVHDNEGLEAAALRELTEETGLPTGDVHLEQLHTYGEPARDPRMRVVSVAFLGLMPDLPVPFAGTDAVDARFWPVATLAEGVPPLAFDHGSIIDDGVEQARLLLESTNLATRFVEEPFTVGDLRRVYETVWGAPLHAANFRRKALSIPGLLVSTGEERATGRGWSELYRAGPTEVLRPPILRPDPDTT